MKRKCNPEKEVTQMGWMWNLWGFYFSTALSLGQELCRIQSTPRELLQEEE